MLHRNIARFQPTSDADFLVLQDADRAVFGVTWPVAECRTTLAVPGTDMWVVYAHTLSLWERVRVRATFWRGFDKSALNPAYATLLPGGEGAQSCLTHSLPSKTIIAFFLLRDLGEQAEIITLGVRAEYRGRGLARALLAHGMAALPPGRRVFLEVAVDNAPAIALYQSLGFKTIATRRGYYPRGDKVVDAWVMERGARG